MSHDLTHGRDKVVSSFLCCSEVRKWHYLFAVHGVTEVCQGRGAWGLL